MVPRPFDRSRKCIHLASFTKVFFSNHDYKEHQTPILSIFVYGDLGIWNIFFDVVFFIQHANILFNCLITPMPSCIIYHQVTLIGEGIQWYVSYMDLSTRSIAVSTYAKSQLQPASIVSPLRYLTLSVKS